MTIKKDKERIKKKILSLYEEGIQITKSNIKLGIPADRQTPALEALVNDGFLEDLGEKITGDAGAPANIWKVIEDVI